MSEFVKCNLCDSGSTFENSKEVNQINCHVRKFAQHEFTVWRCSNCGSLHSKEEVDLKLYYDHYPFKNHRMDLHTKVAYKNRLKMLEVLGLNREHKVLDFGCGAGLFVDFLQAKGYRNVDGYDAFIPRFSDAKVLEQQYDVVTSYDVIEHVDDPHSYFETLVKLTRKGGLLVVGTPNASRIGLYERLGPAVELSQPYHRHIFSEKALFTMAAKHGLRPLDVYRRFYFDSLVPSVNTRFMWEYVRQTGGMIDVAVEPLKVRKVFSSARLFFFSLFGYFIPERKNILVTFLNQGDSEQAQQQFKKAA